MKVEYNIVDKKTTKQVRIDAGWHQILKDLAKSQGRSITNLLDEIFSYYISSKQVLKKVGDD